MVYVKKLRKQAGISQFELSEKIGVNRSTIAKWETGVSSPRAKIIPNVAKALECEVSDLFSDSSAETIVASDVSERFRGV